MEIWKVRAELDDKVEALTINEEKNLQAIFCKGESGVYLSLDNIHPLVVGGKDSANDLVEEHTLDAMVASLVIILHSIRLSNLHARACSPFGLNLAN
ncbi:hypothetical protein V6N12_063980 [Hibiscus sabdariffa]|uniref:Uncharacterized protein n=1 Tax=Hibiscus sabdariffa TaxID=183260 RepID=A0ABR2ALQ9_9ROSI